MGNVNKVFLMGNLTRDVEVKTIGDSQTVAKFGLAVNRRFKSAKSSEMTEETTFVDCEAWGKTAQIIGERFGKGKPIHVEGRLRLDQWKDKESGENRSKLMVVVTDFTFVDSKSDSGGDTSEGSAEPSQESVNKAMENIPF